MALGNYPSAACVLTLTPNNNSGYYKRAAAIGLEIAIGNAAGFLATFIYTSDQAPLYIRGHSIALGAMIMGWFFMLANVCYSYWENKARQEGRRDQNLVKYQELWDSGKTRAPIGDRHPMFRFTL